MHGRILRESRSQTRSRIEQTGRVEKGYAPTKIYTRLLSTAEQNYSTIEKELLAIVYSVNHFRPYIYGNKFTLVTDHKPLVWLNSVKDPTSRLIRWRLKLAEYEYEIMYKAGKTNVNADTLSRNPVVSRTLMIESNAYVKENDRDDTKISNRKNDQIDSPGTASVRVLGKCK